MSAPTTALIKKGLGAKRFPGGWMSVSLVVAASAFYWLLYGKMSLFFDQIPVPMDEPERTGTPPHKLAIDGRVKNKTTTKKQPRIAIMSSFVPNAGAHPPPRLKEEYLQHIVNKACYSYIWGYDFIFNTTSGFDDTYKKWHWLDFGCWNKIPHVASRLREYDWIFYTDTDYLIQDVTRPLEAFLHEFELYGKTNVQLFVPTDYYDRNTFTFSNYAFMIRNSPFGFDLLKYWDAFARGICPKGNLNKTASKQYNWMQGDQPGLWYAMMRTYADYFPDRVPKNNYPLCNETVGVLESHSTPWNNYFKAMVNLTKGSTGEELARVPDDQPYIYSSLPNGQRSGMSLNLNWGRQESMDKYNHWAFGFHAKNIKDDRISPGLAAELEYCRKDHGCYAHYNELGELKIGCGDQVYL